MLRSWVQDDEKVMIRVWEGASNAMRNGIQDAPEMRRSSIRELISSS
jgi:hypothetical protein